MKSPSPGGETNERTRLFLEVRLYLAAFIAVSLATYVALAYGLGWIVVVASIAGLLYCCWLVVGMGVPPRVPLNEREDLPTDMELPPGSEDRPSNGEPSAR